MALHKMVLSHWIYSEEQDPTWHQEEDEVIETPGHKVLVTNCVEINNLTTGETYNLNFLDKPNKWKLVACREPVYTEEDISDGINEDQGKPIVVILDRWEEEVYE